MQKPRRFTRMLIRKILSSSASCVHCAPTRNRLTAKMIFWYWIQTVSSSNT
ncbi:Uncharacterised protein [Vibrio cholerae]|nr:Uncharacterised protein [Vibrio cholerae]